MGIPYCPVSAAPAPEQNLTYTVGQCIEQCQKARTDERERLLEKLHRWVDSIECDWMEADEYSMVRSEIESLRGERGEREQQLSRPHTPAPECNAPEDHCEICDLDCPYEKVHSRPVAAPAPKNIGEKCTIEDCTCNKFVTCDECRSAFQEVRERQKEWHTVIGEVVKRAKAEEREQVLDELVRYCREVKGSDSWLLEMDAVPIDDIEYAADKLKKGESLRGEQK